MQVKHLEFKKLPKGIEVDHYFLDAVQWKDSMGANLVVLSGTLENQHDAKPVNELYAWHYLFEKDSAVKTWKIHDGVIDCNDRILATFVKSATQVTDLDSNGVAEVWLLYKKNCGPDTAEGYMKLVMFEGNKTCSLTGTYRVYLRTDEHGGKHYMGGTFGYDTPFAEGPRVFLDYATALWNKHIMGN